MNAIPELLNSAVLKEVGAMKNIARVVFKWLSKVNTWLRLLRFVIGLKISRQFFNQWGTKAKPTAPCTCDFSRAWSKMQVTARNSDWFMVRCLLLLRLVGVNYFGIGSSKVIWKPLSEKTKNKTKANAYGNGLLLVFVPNTAELSKWVQAHHDLSFWRSPHWCEHHQ